MSSNKSFVINKDTIQTGESQPISDKPPLSGRAPISGRAPTSAKPQLAGIVPFNGHPGAKQGSSHPVTSGAPRSMPPKQMSKPPVPLSVAAVSQPSGSRPGSVSSRAGYPSGSQAGTHVLGSEFAATHTSAIEQLPKDNSRWLWIAIVVLCSLVTLLVTHVWYEKKLHKSAENVAKMKVELATRTKALASAHRAAILSRAPAQPKLSAHEEISLGTAGLANKSGAAPGAAGAADALPILFEDIAIAEEKNGKVVSVVFDLRNKGATALNTYVFIVLRYLQKDGKAAYVGYPEKPVGMDHPPLQNLTKGIKIHLTDRIEKLVQIPVSQPMGHLDSALFVVMDAKGHLKQQTKRLGE